jgi:hypothetical protein
MLNGDFKGGSQEVYLAGSCGDGGGSFVGQANIGGRAYPVVLSVLQRGQNGQLTDLTLAGALPAGAGNFRADIALASDNQ